MAISLTETAVKEVKTTMQRQGLPQETTYLRVGVSGGGCSGFSYSMGFTNEKQDADELFDCDGVRIICDPKGYLYLKGAEIDFQDGLTGRGFTFRNPNATGSCGCGSSFSV